MGQKGKALFLGRFKTAQTYTLSPLISQKMIWNERYTPRSKRKRRTSRIFATTNFIPLALFVLDGRGGAGISTIRIRIKLHVCQRYETVDEWNTDFKIDYEWCDEKTREREREEEVSQTWSACETIVSLFLWCGQTHCWLAVLIVHILGHRSDSILVRHLWNLFSLTIFWI
jgi:hypothetical protein